MRFSLITFVILLFLVFPAGYIVPVHAQDDPDLEELMEGFEENEPGDDAEEAMEGFDGDGETEDQEKDATDKPTNTDKKKDAYEGWPSYLSPAGHVKIGASYNFAHDEPEIGETDWRGLSRLKNEFMFELGAKYTDSWQAFASAKCYYDLAYIAQSRDNFTEEVLDSNEMDATLWEAWLQGSLFKNLDIKLGRQIVVWGRSDNIRVTDILNPLDMREPGITDIEDLRIPIAMSKLDYYIGKWGLSGIAIHEAEFNNNPAFGSDFYPGSTRPPEEDLDLETTEYAASLTGIFSGWDISFYWADMYNDTAHIELTSVEVLFPGPPPAPPVIIPEYELKHARIKMYGTAGNIVFGSWLFKSEAAYFKGLKFTNTPYEKYSRLDILGGIEYSGFKDTTISLEAVNRHIHGFDEALENSPDQAQKNELQWVFRISRNWLNDTLATTFMASVYGGKGQDGSIQRFSVEYDLTDSLKLTGGVVFYHSGDMPPFKNIGDNDRIYLEIKYSF